ncbi:MAG: adenylate/guanylate cyclase domain-containing protein [Candidatus Omnitrophica bacterium]|nr:adenylate/guanylate cyclase domain-containing protein [Candidatus Omnitrophota bacterium]
MKKSFICLILSLGVAFLLLFLENKPFYQILDLKLYDLMMNLRKPPAQDPRILFVEMDEEAVNNLGRWPWPRNIFAHIIDTLQSLGARQIIFDVTFSEPTQVIVDKQAVGYIFQGKEQIDRYITDEAGIIKGKDTVPQQEALFALNQIQDNFLAFTNTAEKKLQNALIDNDQVLADAFKNSRSFIGYAFEVFSENRDIQKNRIHPKLKSDIGNWVKENIERPFDALPSSLKNVHPFSRSEMENIFLHAKLQFFIQKDIEISPERAAEALHIAPKEIASDFYLVKHQWIEDKISTALAQNPQAKFIDMIYQFEIFDPDTQESFKEVWTKVKKEFEAGIKFGKPLFEGQEFFKAKDMEAPIEPIIEAVQGGGFLNGIPHQDGVLRFVPLFIEYKNRIFPHIAIASILDLYQPQEISFDPGRHLILHNANVAGHLENVRVPIDQKGAMLINWAGRWQDTFRHISGADIYRLYFLSDSLADEETNSDRSIQLQQKLQEEETALRKKVQGSLCIIGLTAAGTHDFNPIPYESTYPMVGTHGNVLNSILTNQFITQATPAANLTVLFVLAVIMGLCLSFLSSAHGLFFTICILAGTFAGSLYWFHQGIWLNLASPCLLSLFSYLGTTSYKFSTEEKSKREIKNAFSKYVSPDVIEEIIQDPSKLRLGGDRRTLAVLFSDIRGFTTYSEKRNPEEVVSILNEYLDAMTKVIVEHKGTLDKYVGDEIMAVFGAPRYEDPKMCSQRAVICAVKMLERLKELHQKWTSEGLEPLDIGIGINTGEMVVGNMGSELRMNYTVIGDAVNLGARVEAATRQFNAHLIITEATYEYTKDIITVKPLETIKVKGKEIPVMIYEVLALKNGIGEPVSSSGPLE